MKLKIDLHVHSKYSKDGVENISDIIYQAKKKGLDGIALTDHNTMEGLIEAKKEGSKNDILVISGCEIKSISGDILAYGVTNVIKKKMSVKNTIDAIHKQGGVAVAAHPYPEITHRTKMYKFLDFDFDAIETANGRSILRNKKAKKIATKLKRSQTGGSDAHGKFEIGNAYTEIEVTEKTEKDVILAIKNGNNESILVKNTSIYSFFYHVIKLFLKK
ncbi:MAG: CehA/McbA family metallohydrolase [Candidatus Aenigmarchaeota archaeon]|nr:CehA/McbA family metallohydrolase [Candidatus Aenigmarchaeota archaeon]